MKKITLFIIAGIILILFLSIFTIFLSVFMVFIIILLGMTLFGFGTITITNNNTIKTYKMKWFKLKLIKEEKIIE